MINNRFDVECETCGKRATVTVHANSFDDTPPGFNAKRVCSGACEDRRYATLTPQQMQEQFKLPTSGWSEAKY